MAKMGCLLILMGLLIPWIALSGFVTLGLLAENSWLWLVLFGVCLLFTWRWWQKRNE